MMSAWMWVQSVLLIAVLPAAGHFFRGWRHGGMQTACCLLLFFGYIWALGQQIINYITLYQPHEEAHLAALYLCYFGMCVLGPASIYLAWRYGGKYKLYRNKLIMIALFGTGALFYAAVLTNELHHLYYTYFSLERRSYGPLFYMFCVFSYTCFVYATVSMQTVHLDGRSVRLFLLCFLPPVAANTWGIFTSPALDFTPLAFCIMVVGANLILWKHRPMVLKPVAAKRVLDSMGHPVMIKSPDGNILYQGGAAEEHHHTYCDVATVLGDGNTIVMRTDVTMYQDLQDELNTQIDELEAIQRQLSERAGILSHQSDMATELAAAEKRMEITALLEQEIRSRLEALLAHTEEAITSLESETLAKGFDDSSETLELVRQLVRQAKRGAGP